MEFIRYKLYETDVSLIRNQRRNKYFSDEPQCHDQSYSDALRFFSIPEKAFRRRVNSIHGVSLDGYIGESDYAHSLLDANVLWNEKQFGGYAARPIHPRQRLIARNTHPWYFALIFVLLADVVRTIVIIYVISFVTLDVRVSFFKSFKSKLFIYVIFFIIAVVVDYLQVTLSFSGKCGQGSGEI